jgi:hypothetical protein
MRTTARRRSRPIDALLVTLLFFAVIALFGALTLRCQWNSIASSAPGNYGIICR